MLVYFDASFLIAVSETPTSWKDDITDALGRFTPVLLECVEEELKGIAAGAGRRAAMAKVALEISSGFQKARCGGASADDELMSSALSTGGAVATVDRELQESLRAARVKTIGLRSGRTALI